MSKDYNVFLKNPEDIKATDFETFAYKLGYFIRVYPFQEIREYKSFTEFK